MYEHRTKCRSMSPNRLESLGFDLIKKRTKQSNLLTFTLVKRIHSIHMRDSYAYDSDIPKKKLTNVKIHKNTIYNSELIFKTTNSFHSKIVTFISHFDWNIHFIYFLKISIFLYITLRNKTNLQSMQTF